MTELDHKTFTERCIEAEFHETPLWAAERVLDVEILTPQVLDPCAGNGVLGLALRNKGYRPHNLKETDLHNWPDQPEWIWSGRDFLSEHYTPPYGEFSVMMNPPFSKAVQFLEKSLELGARKVIMFQRFSFMESGGRRAFWDDKPPSRVWLCGDRAQCWRADVPEEDQVDENGEKIKGRRGRSSSTAHAWFVWERDHRVGAPTIHRLYREAKNV